MHGSKRRAWPLPSANEASSTAGRPRNATPMNAYENRPDCGTALDPPGGTAMALQGGAAHGAFAWGVLDRLLERGVVPDRVCGVSAGAMLGAVMVQGLVEDGPEGGRAAMHRLWQGVASAGAMSPVRSSPLEKWLYGRDLSNNMA